MLYPALWVYQTSVKTSTSFSPFQLVHGVDSILPIEFEIHYLRLEITHLESLDEQRRDASTTIEVNKRRVKIQYDKFVCPRLYTEGDMVLLYYQDKEPLGESKFQPMWQDPYILQRDIEKGAYKLKYYEWNMLVETRNGIYLK
jgi:hypothetical protein